MKVLPAAMLAVALFVAACGNEQAEPPADVADPTASLHALFDEFFERGLELNPMRASTIGDYRFNDQFANSIGPEHREASRLLDETFLARLLNIERKQLSRQDRLSYDMFRLNREQSLEGERFPGHLQPINQRLQVLNSFVQLGSGTSVHPFKTIKDYDDWLSRIDGFVVYVDQAIANMREGVRQGVVQPRILMVKSLPQIESQIVDTAQDSGFWAPIENMPDAFSNEERERLSVAFKDAIENKVIPSYKRVANFIGDEYLAAARDTVGLYALPDGAEWYAYNVRRVTTTDLAPDEIHQIGLDEVARIHNEIRGVMTDVGFEGDLKDFFDYMNGEEKFYFDAGEELIQGYRDMFERISALSTNLFDVFPKGGLEVRRVEPFREASAGGASYRTGTPDGSRAGVFYANTYDIKSRPIWVMESLFLHEAIPGHHFQRSLQVENEDLPNFRRFGGYSAFTEGWGLYAETLGKEIGVYTDPYQYFGALNGELWRAIRLVVDTGVHTKQWTRQDVLDFMYANSAVKEARAASEADRVIAVPGQVLAYKIGQLKIRELRDDAEERLGDQFDVKAFHTQVLMDGPMPLSMLEDKIGDWVESQLAQSSSGNVEPAKQSDDAKLVFPSLELDQTNRGSININGYDRHFSVTFPTSYDNSVAYPVVLFFHGCMCRPDFTEESILSYLDWKPRLESYKDDFITIKMSAFSEKKPEVPQEVDEGGARGMWFWHEALESERDDYAFVDTLLTELLSSSDINIDPQNIFAVGHSSGAIFLISYVLGGPSDLSNVSINDTYTFRAISVTGGSTLRKGVVDFKENTPGTLPSVLHIQGEQDGGLWFNGQETGKSGINFLEFASAANGSTIIDGLRDTVHGLTYSAWDENTPSNPSTLQKWAEHLNLEYSGYEDYSQYYLYNFAPLTTSEKVLVGVRIKDCGHSLTADQYQSDFFRVFSEQNGDLSEYDSVISRDTAMTFC